MWTHRKVGTVELGPMMHNIQRKHRQLSEVNSTADNDAYSCVKNAESGDQPVLSGFGVRRANSTLF